MMIRVNDYFDGKIKSLGFELDRVPYTTGVLLPGSYSIKTEKQEHITITIGDCEVRPPDSGWKKLKAGDTVVIPARATFEMKVEKPASYVCMYK